MRYFLILLLTAGIFTACQKENSPVTVFEGAGPADWLIPKSEVFDGGLGKNGIPSVDQPKFSAPEALAAYYDNNLVLGFVHNGVTKAYPHPILDWHEIVNDEIGELPLQADREWAIC